MCVCTYACICIMDGCMHVCMDACVDVCKHASCMLTWMYYACALFMPVECFLCVHKCM